MAEQFRIRTGDMRHRVVCEMKGLLETVVESGADIVLTAVVGMVGIQPTVGCDQRWHGCCAGKQGNSGYGRTSDHASRQGKGREDSSGGQRAQRHFPVLCTASDRIRSARFC